MANSYDVGGLLIANLYKNEAISFMCFFVFNDTPVETVGRMVPIVVIRENIFAIGKVEVTKKTVFLIQRVLKIWETVSIRTW